MAYQGSQPCNGPHQPKKFSFSKRSFGKEEVVQRSFQPKWFDKYNWLHYDESSDSLMCHVCSRADREGKLKSALKDAVFISSGYRFQEQEGRPGGVPMTQSK